MPGSDRLSKPEIIPQNGGEVKLMFNQIYPAAEWTWSEIVFMCTIIFLCVLFLLMDTNTNTCYKLADEFVSECLEAQGFNEFLQRENACDQDN